MRCCSVFLNLFTIPEERLEALYDELDAYTATASPLVIRDTLTWDEVSRVEVHRTDLPGMHVEDSRVRTYPLGESAAHVCGLCGFSFAAGS